MTEVQVVWLPPAIEKWSGGILQRLFAGDVWQVPGITYRQVSQRSAAKDEPAVVIVPGEEWAPRTKVAELNRYIARFSHVVLIVIADEGSTFLWERVDHPALRMWIQTPRPGVHPDTDEMFYFGFGWHPDTLDVLRALPEVERDVDWFFSGQVTHERRDLMIKALHEVEGSTVIHQTDHFGGGMPRHEYLREMTRSRAVPCPSGPCTPDSFRFYEAMEAGCIPVVDGECPAYEGDYWALTYGQTAASMLRIAQDWSAALTEDVPRLAFWERPYIGAWWALRKREMAWRLRQDVLGPDAPGMTVLMSTSWIPSCPSTEIIDETIASVRAQLPDAEIIVMADGHIAGNATPISYVDYLQALGDRCRNDWQNVMLIPFASHHHQAQMIARTLPLVRTPLVLFMEHDTPLCGEIPWQQLGDVILSGQANVIRLSSEAMILEPWRHLYLDTQDNAHDVMGVPLVRTVQWSSRPHLADTDWYRRVIDTYFDPSCRTFTEDVLHGVVDHAWRTRREAGWREWRLWIYAPPGDMKRSLHTDGRAGAEKAGMSFAYPGGETPPGAPRTTADRAPE